MTFNLRVRPEPWFSWRPRLAAPVFLYDSKLFWFLSQVKEADRIQVVVVVVGGLSALKNEEGNRNSWGFFNYQEIIYLVKNLDNLCGLHFHCTSMFLKMPSNLKGFSCLQVI